MPQINSRRLFGKLDRKRFVVAAIVAGVGFGGWCLLHEKPRAVEEAEWDSIVFPEMAGLPVSDVEPAPGSAARPTPWDAASPPQPERNGMQFEVAANAALQLDAEWKPAAKPIPREPGISLLTQPTRLEGGIEPIDAPAQ